LERVRSPGRQSVVLPTNGLVSRAVVDAVA
jgi:hypothetical protein